MTHGGEFEEACNRLVQPLVALLHRLCLFPICLSQRIKHGARRPERLDHDVAPRSSSSRRLVAREPAREVPQGLCDALLGLGVG